MSSLHEAARLYHALGLHPIPLEPRGKRPLLASWKPYQDTQPTVEEIDTWWTATPDANIGLVLGRSTFALDIDGPSGMAALTAAGLTYPELFNGDAAIVETGKGWHLYYRGQVPDRIAMLDHVDVRGVGYVVAPPSIHPNGRTYAWVGGSVKAFPQPPAALLALIRKDPKPASTASASWVVDALAGAGEGERDVVCTRLAGYLWGKGLPQDVVEALMQEWGARCTPPFPPEQVTKCVVSITARDGGPVAPPMILREAVTVAVAEILAPPQLRRPLLPSGFTKLDELMVGLGSELLYLGARPSIGKTALALTLSLRHARAGRGVLYVTREMTRTQLARRLLAMDSLVPLQDLKRGDLLPHQMVMLKESAARLAELPLWITHDAKSPAGIDEVIGGFSPGELALVVVDYLQLLRSDMNTRDSRQRVEECSQALKDIVVKHDLPVMCLSSLSRPPKDKAGWEPSMSDLRESGELEHDADIIWLMHRADTSQPEGFVNVAKNRDGQVGKQYLKFYGASMQFEEVGI